MERYKNLLLTLVHKRQYPLWIVDAPDAITTADINFEIESFAAATGALPRVLYIDYANLVNPVGDYSNISEKLDILFIEFTSIAKRYGLPIVTSVRESRKGALSHDREEIDQEHIAQSGQIIHHVHHLWHIDQTKDERAQNIVQLRCKKNRFGEKFETTLFVAPEYSYIGDRELNQSDFSFD
jgi:hypothetical protein